MQNVEITKKGKTIIIRINANKSFGKSKSGKTIMVASTKGNKPIEGTDLLIGLNVYKYPEDDDDE